MTMCSWGDVGRGHRGEDKACMTKPAFSADSIPAKLADQCSTQGAFGGYGQRKGCLATMLMVIYVCVQIILVVTKHIQSISVALNPVS